MTQHISHIQLSLGLIKHHARMMYGGMEIKPDQS